MKNLIVKAGGHLGRIYEGENPQTYCFVPDDCIIFEDGKVRIEEGDYIRSGWDVRNMRFNDSGLGQHLFPNLDRPIMNLEADSVRVFLDRIENVQAA